VPQEIAVYPDLSARENLRFFGRLYGLRDPELGECVDDVLETIGLSNRADQCVQVLNFRTGRLRRAG
jgi:ABC-2 type transport system ATP-binding protein